MGRHSFYPLQHLKMTVLHWRATKEDRRSTGSMTACHFIDSIYYSMTTDMQSVFWCTYWIGGKAVFYLQYIQSHWQRICLGDYLMRLQKSSKSGATVK